MGKKPRDAHVSPPINAPSPQTPGSKPEEGRGAPARRGKYLSLSLLVAQNASIAILTRLSRLPRTGPVAVAPGGQTSAAAAVTFEPFIAATAVFVTEVVKWSMSLYMAASIRRSRSLERARKDAVPRGVRGDPATPKPEAWSRAAWGSVVQAVGPGTGGQVFQVGVPSVLYAIQNNLLYIALSHLDTPTYSVTYQLKILSAALFNVILFRRPLSLSKWFSLCLLTLGVAIVQLSATGSPVAATQPAGGENPLKGFLAIAAACLCSGLAGSWFERLLKPRAAKGPATVAPPPSLWTRNLQIASVSIAFTSAGMFLSPSTRSAIARRGFFAGYDLLTWAVILNQALGGLLVAVVVRDAGSVEKGFATSLAIVVSTIVSAALFNFIPGLQFVLGAFLVVLSTILYAISS